MNISFCLVRRQNQKFFWLFEKTETKILLTFLRLRCTSVPNLIVSFDQVITIEADWSVTYTMEHSSYIDDCELLCNILATFGWCLHVETNRRALHKEYSKNK